MSAVRRRRGRTSGREGGVGRHGAWVIHGYGGIRVGEGVGGEEQQTKYVASAKVSCLLPASALYHHASTSTVHQAAKYRSSQAYSDDHPAGLDSTDEDQQRLPRVSSPAPEPGTATPQGARAFQSKRTASPSSFLSPPAPQTPAPPCSSSSILLEHLRRNGRTTPTTHQETRTPLSALLLPSRKHPARCTAH